MVDVTEILRKGIAAHEAGDLKIAVDCYQEILDTVPDHADATHLLGLVHFQQGDTDTATVMIKAAIGFNANVPLYHANLGRVFTSAKDHPAALIAFREAVLQAPNDAHLQADLAGAYLRCGDAKEAAARASQAVELSPDLAEAHLNLGLAQQEIFGAVYPLAIQSLQKAVALNPALAGAYLGLGVALHEQGALDDAEQAYTQALRLNSTFLEAHCNLGNLKRDACLFEEAATHYQAALDLDENQAVVWGNLGVALQEAGKLDEALEAYNKAVLLDFDNADIRRNRGMALLASGQYVKGWADYEYRLKTPKFRLLARDWPAPKWDGGDPEGLHILVHAEQGYGDTLQFCRYIPGLIESGAKVTFECADVLMPLMELLDGAPSLILPGADIPEIDAHISLMSLPGVLGTALESVPNDVPYLKPPETAQNKWNAIVDTWPSKTKVGIAWRGSPEHPRDALRSPGLQPFLRLLDREDLVIVSLQKDGGAEDLTSYADTETIIDPTDLIEDFADTAALIEKLDVVVSCDSAPLHLAGALGKETIAVLPHVAEWRWGEKGDHTPWYPSMMLLRQPKPGDWSSVIEQVNKCIN